MGSTAHFPFNCLIKKTLPSLSLSLPTSSLSLSLSLSLPFRHSQQLPTSPSHRIINATTHNNCLRASQADPALAMIGDRSSAPRRTGWTMSTVRSTSRLAQRRSVLSPPQPAHNLAMILLSSRTHPPRVSTLQNQTTHRLQPLPCRNPPHHHQSTINDKQKTQSKHKTLSHRKPPPKYT